MTKTWKESNTFLKLREAEKNVDIFDQVVSVIENNLFSNKDEDIFKENVELSLQNILPILKNASSSDWAQEIGLDHGGFEGMVDGCAYLGAVDSAAEVSEVIKNIEDTGKAGLYVTIGQVFPSIKKTYKIDDVRSLAIAITSGLRERLMTDSQVGVPYVRNYYRAFLGAIQLDKNSDKFYFNIMVDEHSKNTDIAYIECFIELPINGDVSEDAKKAADILGEIMNCSAVANEYLDFSSKYSR